MNRIHFRSISAFFVSLCLTLAASGSQGDPAQEPLFISGATIPGKPNIMLMLDTSGSMSTKVTANNDTRINIAKTAAKNMVDALTPPENGEATVRLGLATYNGSIGGKLWSPVTDLDATQAGSIKARISGFSASGVTPLATTLLDIGKYFSTGQTGSLTLHSGESNQATATLDEIFTHTDGNSGLLGFTPQQTCTVTTTGIDPGQMPTGYTPPCSCNNFIAGGADTLEAASDTTANPSIQMLVVGSQPTFCTASTSPSCATQQNYNSCQCGSTPPCPSCSDTTGTQQSIWYENTPTPPSIAIGNTGTSGRIQAHITGIDDSQIAIQTNTSSTCELDDRYDLTRDCDDNDCYIRGRANGLCRVCATYAGTNPQVCTWPASSGSCTLGDQRCSNWSHTGNNGCQSTTDTWREWVSTGWSGHWVSHSCYCMNNDVCENKEPGDTWRKWNYQGCSFIGQSICLAKDWWGHCTQTGNCQQTSGTCSSIDPETCNCTTGAGTQCVVSQTDINIGTGTASGGCSGNSGNGNTGGNLNSGNLCFNPSKYYTVKYSGSPDIIGPFKGDQFNWYFSQLGFTEGSLELPTTNGIGTCTTTNAPIQTWCQKSFVVLISDGLPNYDRTVSTFLRDYTGDCATKGLCNITPNSLQLPGPSTPLTSTGTKCNKTGGANNMVCQNGTKAGRAYETGGSDYLDDVAQALYEMDLRPSLDSTKKVGTKVKNNLTTYAIGFADPILNTSSILSDAARLGGGKFFYAADANALASALNTVIGDISTQVASSASVATNSTQVDTDSLIYQGRFDTGGWFGDLIAFPVNADGTLGDEVWNAGVKIPNDGLFTDGDYNASSNGRTILTYNPQAASGNKGTLFLCDNLGAAQKTALEISSCSSTTDQGVWRVDYLRGDKTHELLNGKRDLWSNETESRSTDPAVALFRNRTRLDINNHARTPDPWLLGDIVNSNPVYVSTTDYLYSALPEGQGTNGYAAFRASIANRRPMIYVGADDGMLHGFDASKATSTAGQEIVSYVPAAVYGHLKDLTDPGYGHRYFVDGSPVVGDAYLTNQWLTVLVGTTGAGGRGVFALDVTDPGASASSTSGFSGSSVLWEFSDTAAPNSLDLTTDSASLRGFQKNLGYTLPQAAIVRLHDGSWAALVANGYSSTNNLAVLYLVDLKTGHIIRALNPVNSNESSFTSANGLSTPFAADVDADRIADYIYAGDLRGNLWKFDVTSSTASEWSVANSGQPLYVACDQDMTLACSEAHRQPITSKPLAGLAGAERPNDKYMVYFGTGKYFESTDNGSTQRETFYGIVDNSVTVPTAGTTTRGNLVGQTTTNVAATDTTPISLRTTTANGCAKDGWFTDLPDAGERVTEFPQLRNGRLIFTTLIPPTNNGTTEGTADPCGVAAASGGSGWLMELSASCGKPIDTDLPPWDLNGDNIINSSDLVGADSPVSPTGRKSTVGIPTAPTIVSIPPTEGNGVPKCEGGVCERKMISGSK